MDRIIDASNGNARVFTDGNDLAGIAGTIVAAAWLNGAQEELVGLIEALGLTPNSADNTLVLRAISLVGRRGTPFSLPGVTAWVCPRGVYLVRYRVWGGGGAGGAGTTVGAGGSGGGPGGYTEGFAAVTPGSSYSVTVGAGGSPASGASGAAGGTSSFSVFGSSTGGGGGYFSSGGPQTTAVGYAGGGSGGIFTPSLPSGGQAIAISASFCLGGASGGSFGSQGNSGSGGLGGSGSVPGAGGGGGANGANGGNNAGAGGNGYVVLEY